MPDGVARHGTKNVHRAIGHWQRRIRNFLRRLELTAPVPGGIAAMSASPPADSNEHLLRVYEAELERHLVEARDREDALLERIAELRRATGRDEIMFFSAVSVSPKLTFSGLTREASTATDDFSPSDNRRQIRGEEEWYKPRCDEGGSGEEKERKRHYNHAAGVGDNLVEADEAFEEVLRRRKNRLQIGNGEGSRSREEGDVKRHLRRFNSGGNKELHTREEANPSRNFKQQRSVPRMDLFARRFENDSENGRPSSAPSRSTKVGAETAERNRGTPPQRRLSGEGGIDRPMRPPSLSLTSDIEEVADPAEPGSVHKKVQSAFSAFERTYTHLVHETCSPSFHHS